MGYRSVAEIAEVKSSVDSDGSPSVPRRAIGQPQPAWERRATVALFTLIPSLHRIDQLQRALEKFFFGDRFQVSFALGQHALSDGVGIK